MPDATRATHDELISRFTRVPPDQTEQDLILVFRRFEAERQTASALTLAIADARTDEFLGLISLLRFVWDRRTADVGYWVAPWARGRGVATRAVRLLSHWAFAEFRLTRLGLYTTTDNSASQRVAERCGFTRGEVLPADTTHAWRNVELVAFSVLARDLR